MEAPNAKTPEQRFISNQDAHFFGAAQDAKILNKAEVIPNLYKTAYGTSEAKPAAIQGRVKELISYLKDPRGVKTDMGEKMIVGAFRVMDYLKSQAKTSSAQREIAVIKGELEGAKSKYLQEYLVNTKITHLLGAHTTNVVDLDPLRFFLAENEELFPMIREFIELSESVKLNNLELLGRHDGNLGNDEDEEFVRATEIMSEIQFHLKGGPEFQGSKSSGGSLMTSPEDREKIGKILYTIYEGSLLTNTQAFIDLLTEILPENMRHGHFPTDRSEVRRQVIQQKKDEVSLRYDQITNQEVKKINHSDVSPEQKEKAIKEIRKQRDTDFNKASDEWLYLPRAGNFIFEKDSWSDVTLGENSVFVKGDKVYGMMTEDRQKKIERHIPLDLSQLDLKNGEQCRQSFELISLLLNIGIGKPAIYQEWMSLIKNLGSREPTYASLMQICEKDSQIKDLINLSTALTPEQKRMVLAKALEFSYHSIHFLRLARLELHAALIVKVPNFAVP